MKAGNGQSKYCINGPKFAHVVRSITAILLDKNIYIIKHINLTLNFKHFYHFNILKHIKFLTY